MLGSKHVTRDREIVDMFRDLSTEIRKLVDNYIPYTVRDVYITSPKISDIWRGELTLLFRRKLRVPYFFAPALKSTYTFEIYRKPIGLRSIDFFIAEGAFREAIFDWGNALQYNTWTRVTPEWGFYLLFSSKLISQNWWENSKIKTTSRFLTEFFRELTDLIREVEEIPQYRILRTRRTELLSRSRTKLLNLKIWDPSNYVRRVIIKYNVEKESMEITVDFKNYGVGWITYDNNSVSIDSWATSKERVLRHIERMDLLKLIRYSVKDAVNDFLESYIKVLLALRILNV